MFTTINHLLASIILCRNYSSQIAALENQFQLTTKAKKHFSKSDILCRFFSSKSIWRMNRIKNLQPKLSRASTRRGEPREKNASCLYLKYNRTQTLFSALCLFARLLYALLIALLISLFGLHLKKQKMIWLADTKTWWLKMRAKRGSYFEYLHNENCFFWWFSALPLGDMSLCVIDAYRISDR